MGETATGDLSQGRDALGRYLALIEQQRAGGTRAIGLDEHAAIVRIAQELLELAERYRSDWQRQILATQLLIYKRGRGRPPKITIGSLGRGPSPRSKAGHHSRKYSEAFLATLYARVQWRVSTASADGEKITAREALRRDVDDFAKTKEPDESKRRARVSRMVGLWEPILSRYRKRIGKPIYAKLQQAEKSPDFSPLLQLWNPLKISRVQQPRKSGKEKHGDATSSTPRSKGKDRTKP